MVCLIYTTLALQPVALTLWVHVSGKPLLPMLQLIIHSVSIHVCKSVNYSNNATAELVCCVITLKHLAHSYTWNTLPLPAIHETSILRKVLIQTILKAKINGNTLSWSSTINYNIQCTNIQHSEIWSKLLLKSQNYSKCIHQFLGLKCITWSFKDKSYNWGKYMA